MLECHGTMTPSHTAFPRNSAALRDQIKADVRDHWRRQMNAPKASGQQQQQSQSQDTHLDKRYGKIGISAVAAAVRKEPDQRKPAYPRFAAHESD